MRKVLIIFMVVLMSLSQVGDGFVEVNDSDQNGYEYVARDRDIPEFI